MPTTDVLIVSDTQDVVIDLVNGAEYLFRVAAVSNGEPGEFAVLDDPVVPHEEAPALAAPGDIPKLGVPRPGVSVLVDHDTTTPLQMVANSRHDAIVVSGSQMRWVMSTTTGNGLRQATNKHGIVLRAGGSLLLQGDGFLPSSMINVFVRSHGSTDTVLLGEIESTAAGTADAKLKLPYSLEPGRYALRLSGLSPQGDARFVSTGVQLKAHSNVTFSIAVQAAKGRVAVTGLVTGSERIVPLRPWLRSFGGKGFKRGFQRIGISDQGAFTWQRKIQRPMVVQLRTRDGVISPIIPLRPR